jgi:hypothetical protein
MAALSGREVIVVEYNKPQIAAEESAIAMIQSMKFNGHPDVLDPNNPIPSNSAYGD